MKFSVCFLVFFMWVFLTQAKVYTRCGLTEELMRRNFPKIFVGNWVCLIESESGKDTSKIKSRANGSKSLGLFQISSKEWCTFGKRGGKCNVRCEDLVDDDIGDDAVCAKKIFNERGFRAWEGWRRACYKKHLSIPRC